MSAGRALGWHELTKPDMQAIIVSIGDELALGQTLDTNSAWISQQLVAVGCDIVAHVTVPDDQAAIQRAIADAANVADAVIVSGGLGPTADDLTRQAMAELLQQPLEMNASWLVKLEEMFRQRGREMPQSNKIQAMIPRGAKMIENTAGTAPGIEAVVVSADRERSARVFVMPGVPKEMKIMFQRDVLRHIQQQAGGAAIVSTTLHTFGLGESNVAEMLGDLMHRQRNPSVGTTVSGGVVSLRINARFENATVARRQLEQTRQLCVEKLGDLIYGQDDETLESVVGQMLKQSGKKVTTAESCTAGLLAKLLTDLPGSSGYFERGWITYSNQAKTDLLGVDPLILTQHGAVSLPTATAMAEGARNLAKTDYALAISGIAGPDGGSDTKPVGTVCIALAHSGGSVSRLFVFPGDRDWIRQRAAKMALTMLRYHLLGKAMPF